MLEVLQKQILTFIAPRPHITIEAFASLKTKLALKSNIPYNSEIP